MTGNGMRTVGILAHVDAGKTTLAEGMLYLSGSTRKLGRVDRKDAFLDTYRLERARGITIFSKQALLSWKDGQITLLDTPGHVDFSAEMERTLRVLDCAVLVISAPDQVQGHVQTLWRLLKEYRIPTILFINKMDQPGCQRTELMEELRIRLSPGCVDFGTPREELHENLALCDEALLEGYLEGKEIGPQDIAGLIRERKVFPCYFGSALRLEGVEELLDALLEYVGEPEYGEAFGARVYKISRDESGNRLTHMKITGGSLRVKMPLDTGKERDGKSVEKADQIRIYSGAGYQAVSEAAAGSICAVTGLSATFAGQGLGTEPDFEGKMLEPVLQYRLVLPEGCDLPGTLSRLRQLEEEEPTLQVLWNEEAQEIHVKVMGEIQTEILKSMIAERFGLEVEFASGSIVYKETIREAVEGIGHFEPLRHYAEVHLLLEPLERGAGMVFASACSEDELDRNWQRLILTNLQEKAHRGVLTGAEITDMRITLLAGRAHLKHTEGGDFRQAVYRAVRQGLMSAESVLLEPVYEFRLEIPGETVGRAMSDITRMQGSFEGPETQGAMAALTGSAPVASMQDYQREVTAYTRGQGRLFCSLKGYEPCHNPEAVLEAKGYDPEQDADNPCGSVFCAHGAGFYVPWDQVPEYMHLERAYHPEKNEDPAAEPVGRDYEAAERKLRSGWAMDKELEEIFARTYGSGREARSGWAKERFRPRSDAPSKGSAKPQKPKEEYLLVDGYNIIFAWEDLKELAQRDIAAARGKLMDVLCNYQGFKKMTLILVFDAYKVEGGTGSVQKYHNIHVVYTREAETADQYIEKTVHTMARDYRVTVATSDAMEQRIIWGAGASRMSAANLLEEIRAVNRQIREEYLKEELPGGQKLFGVLSKEEAKRMEEIRLGRKEFGEHE